MMPRKSSNLLCMTCNKARDESFRGNRCHRCYKIYQNHYYKENKRMLLDKQTEKRHNEYLKKDPIWIPRKERPRQTKEELALKRKLYSQSDAVKARRKFQYNFKTYVGNPPLRKPVTKNHDRELYADNATWGIDHTMHLNLDPIRYCPMEELTYEHWKKEADELAAWVESQRQKQNGYVSGLVENTYTKKDRPAGELTKNGRLRLHPT